MRPADGWFSVTFNCTAGLKSPQEKWNETRDYISSLNLKTRTHPPGWYDAEALHGAARLAIFKIWFDGGYELREKAEDGAGSVVIYTLSRELPTESYPWSKNLDATLTVLDGFMGTGGCVYERAPVLPELPS